MQKEVRVIKSNRKTISLEIKSDLQIIVRVPRQMTETQIQEFLKKKSGWIEKHLTKIERQAEAFAEPLTQKETETLAQEALEDLPVRVKRYAPLVGVTYGRITIRNQRTRWGSCSSKGNLNFNCLLMLCPPEIRDYVVVHELCHRREMNHSPRFWAEVEKILPDYKEKQKWLKENGGRLIGRLK